MSYRINIIDVPKLSTTQRYVLATLALNRTKYLEQDADGCVSIVTASHWYGTVRTDTLRFLYDWGLLNRVNRDVLITRFGISKLGIRVLERGS